MIGFAIGAVLGVIAAAFVWLHMHHKNALVEIENRVSGYWRDLYEMEEKLVAKIEGKDKA